MILIYLPDTNVWIAAVALNILAVAYTVVICLSTFHRHFLFDYLQVCCMCMSLKPFTIHWLDTLEQPYKV